MGAPAAPRRLAQGLPGRGRPCGLAERFCTLSGPSFRMPGACARCGSTLLQHTAVPGGEYAFEEASAECLHCGNVGEPRHFRTTQDLESFRLTVRARD